MSPVLVYVDMLAFFGLGDWLLPSNFRYFCFPLFKVGIEHDRQFYLFYNRWRVFRMIVIAIVWAPVFFLKYSVAFAVAAASICASQILFFTWRAEVYARRSVKSGGIP